MAPAARPKRIAFLDTNALIDLFYYWETCKALSLQADSVSGIDDIRRAIAGAKTTVQLFSPDLQPIERAMNLFREMHRKQSQWDFYTSEVARSEMHHTLLEFRALERLTQARVPYRMRSERPLIVYRRSLAERDYSSLESDLVQFLQDLDYSYGIIIQIAERTINNLGIVSDAASRIWSRVLLEVMDAFIYASAVTSMANVLITRDGPFCEAVNRLFRPPDSEWRNLKISLGRALGGLGSGWSWPEGRRVQTPLPR